jgi:deoxyadenosine/deoxycytidine kinase
MDMYHGLLPGLELPDRVVAVDAPFEVCLERIVSRGRGGEQHLDQKLARAIYDGYYRWWDSLPDVIWIDSGSLDLASSPQDRASALRAVHEALDASTSTPVIN